MRNKLRAETLRRCIKTQKVEQARPDWNGTSWKSESRSFTLSWIFRQISRHTNFDVIQWLRISQYFHRWQMKLMADEIKNKNYKIKFPISIKSKIISSINSSIDLRAKILIHIEIHLLTFTVYEIRHPHQSNESTGSVAILCENQMHWKYFNANHWTLILAGWLLWFGICIYICWIVTTPVHGWSRAVASVIYRGSSLPSSDSSGGGDRQSTYTANTYNRVAHETRRSVVERRVFGASSMWCDAIMMFLVQHLAHEWMVCVLTHLCERVVEPNFSIVMPCRASAVHIYDWTKTSST